MSDALHRLICRSLNRADGFLPAAELGTKGIFIQLTIKQLLVRSALGMLRGLRLVQRGLAPLGNIISAPFAFFGRGLFRFILLPSYRWYTSIKQSIRLNPRFNDLRSFRHFLERYAVYVALVIFGTLAIGHNLAARTLRPDEVGVGAIWPSFVQSEALDLIVENTPANISKPTGNHMAIGGPVASAATDTSTLSGGASQTTSALPVDAVGGPIVTSPSGSTNTRHGLEQYTVQGGDTISSIAVSFGLGSKTLLWANGLGDNDFIKPGQLLKIPPRDGYLYTVKAGDTLDKIIAKYGGTAQDILDSNDLPTADALQTGQEIIIPGGSPPAPPVPTVTTPQRGLLARLFTEPSNNPPPSAPSGGGRFIWPTTNHKINQYFRGRIHTGIDIEGTYSSPIYAAAAGTVIYASYDLSGYGLHVVVSHGNGYETLYGHASKIFVHAGDRVRQGQTIAMIGSTGRSTGTHLHFEIRTGGGFLNPLIFY